MSPASKIPSASGNGIHDWHAEILSIRAFNHFVLQECRDIALHARPSLFLRRRGAEEMLQARQPFAWHNSVRVHMYCSEAPCEEDPHAC